MAYIKKLVMHGFKSFPRKTEIPFTSGINVVLGPNGSGKCLVGDSIVALGDGSYQRIDKIVNSRLDNAIKTEDGYIIQGDGERVKCLNLETLKIESKPIKSFVKRTSPEKLLSIKTKSGKEITSTKYHPLFILKEGKVTEARADELKEGVRIAVPRRISPSIDNEYFLELLDEITEKDNIYIPYNEKYEIILNSLKKKITWKELSEKIAIPYYAIKGFLDKQSINIFYLIKMLRFARISDLEIINLINVFVSNGKKTNFNFKNSPEFSRFFGYLLAEGRLNPNQIWFTNGTKEVVEDYVYLVRKLFGKEPLIREYKQNCWDIIFYSTPLIRILNKLGLKENSEKKEISNTYLKHSSEKEISELLNGLYCGDGYISNSSIEITTKSKKLSEGIQACLLILGIPSVKKKVTKTIKSIGFSGEYYNIISYGVNNFRIFNKNIQLVHDAKRQRVLSGLNKKANPNSDLIEVNSLIKEIAKEASINIKQTKKEFPSLDAYCYNQCLPSRTGIQSLCGSLFINKNELVNNLEILAYSDIFWDEIEEIKEVEGTDWVYDLCVEKHHNFIANNIIVHNSNISDALCFVLGRLSIKSMRAAKARNLIFLGTKAASPAKEAIVEIIFDNLDKTFSIEKDEISIKRIVRLNGQSIYKINNETKTRQEVLSLLAQAGIDPNGFNIILQGEIQNFVRMHTEERRKIIEEVSGISIYETRKEKSLKELDKTEEKQKEVFSILRERTAYLNNLEKERQQALKYKKLEADIKKFKASIIHFDITKRKSHLKEIQESISKKNREIDKIKQETSKLSEEIKNSEEKIVTINKKIQESTGLEQEKLNQEITSIRADIAGLNVKIENNQNKLSSLLKQKIDTQESIRKEELELKELQDQSPSLAKKEKEIIFKKTELEKLEEKRKRFYMIKSELKSIKEKFEDKKSALQGYDNESNFLVKQIESTSGQLFDKRTSPEIVEELRASLSQKKNILENMNKRQIELEKISFSGEKEIEKENKITETISKMDICPLCKSKITKEHIANIYKEISPKVASLKKELEDSDKELAQIGNKKELLTEEIEKISSEVSKREMDLIKISNINEKKNSIKSLNDKIIISRKELSEIEKLKINLEKELEENSNIEQKYETARIELQEISLRTKENVNSEISFKKREYERLKITLKQLLRDEEDVKEELNLWNKKYAEKENTLEKKRKQEEELIQKFQKLILERDSLQLKIRKDEQDSLIKKNFIYNIEQEINNIKIDKARIDAEIENLEMEMLNFPDIELIKGSRESLTERLAKIQEAFSQIGPVNLRSVEVYDEIKKEYDAVNEKANNITKEKESILKIIHDIDVKKKKVFLKTLNELNEIFSRNFAQISLKGEVSLELENPKEPFEGGVGITVKTGHGKYFDVTSLSGGEQTMVALSLIFAIQELNPYCFYILDEIDAALDKRNSERLGGLLRKYMQKGQYIVITHNDEVITNATNLYGLSMHEGVSKVVSLKI